MENSITLKFTPIQRDYAAVLRWYYWHQAFIRFTIFMMMIACGYVVYRVISQWRYPSPFEIILLILPLYYTWFILVHQPAQIARQAAMRDQLTTETTWEVSPTGIQISSRFRSASLAWSELGKLLAARDYYLIVLKSGKNAFRFIPRRAFTTPGNEKIFLDLVHTHLASS